MLNAFSCRKPLIATVEKQLLGEHLTSILQKGKPIYLYRNLSFTASLGLFGSLGWVEMTQSGADSDTPTHTLVSLYHDIVFQRGLQVTFSLWEERNHGNAIS